MKKNYLMLCAALLLSIIGSVCARKAEQPITIEIKDKQLDDFFKKTNQDLNKFFTIHKATYQTLKNSNVHLPGIQAQRTLQIVPKAVEKHLFENKKEASKALNLPQLSEQELDELLSIIADKIKDKFLQLLALKHPDNARPVFDITIQYMRQNQTPLKYQLEGDEIGSEESEEDTRSWNSSEEEEDAQFTTPRTQTPDEQDENKSDTTIKNVANELDQINSKQETEDSLTQLNASSDNDESVTSNNTAYESDEDEELNDMLHLCRPKNQRGISSSEKLAMASAFVFVAGAAGYWFVQDPCSVCWLTGDGLICDASTELNALFSNFNI